MSKLKLNKKDSRRRLRMLERSRMRESFIVQIISLCQQQPNILLLEPNLSVKTFPTTEKPSADSSEDTRFEIMFRRFYRTVFGLWLDRTWVFGQFSFSFCFRKCHINFRSEFVIRKIFSMSIITQRLRLLVPIAGRNISVQFIDFANRKYGPELPDRMK